MASALRNCDPELRNYLVDHHVPELFEALMCALTVNQPEDGRQFIIDCILQLKEDPSMLQELQWDTFIDDDKKPLNHMMKATTMRFSLCYEDERYRPTYDMLRTAFQFYNQYLLRYYYGGLYAYWQYKKNKRIMLAEKLTSADRYYELKICGRSFKAWLGWKRWEIDRQTTFVNSLTKIVNLSLKRLIFNQWSSISAESRKTREYFEKIERGELIDPTEINMEKKDHISELPKLLAIRIFMFLELPDLVSCSKICRSWKEITQANILWSRIDLANSDKGLITGRAIGILLQKCRPFICHLNMRSCDFLSARTLTMIGDCKNLQDLNLSQCKAVCDDVIKDITVGCPSLLYINLSDTEISDASLRHISRNCNGLQYLNIARCVNITNRGLHYLSSGKGSQKLIYLDMSACDQITREGFRMLAKGCVRLDKLLLNEMHSLTDECIEALMQDCKNLRYLSILHSPLLTDASMRYIAFSRRIQCLKIESNSRMTDASIKLLVKNCSELRYLYFVDIQRATDMSLKALSQCRSLGVLNLADCVRVSDTGVRYIVEGLPGSKIRELNLTNCIRVSDVSLLRISQRCFSLMYANFSYCEHVTDAGIELIAVLPSLTSLDVSGCNITDTGVVALGNNSKIRDLMLSECCSVTDVGLQKLFPNIKGLENLDISHLNQLSDQTLKSLAFCCRRMRCLNIAGCPQLTDQGIQYLSGVCQFIERLDASACFRLTDRSLRFLRKGCVNIKLLMLLYCKNISKIAVTKYQYRIRGKIFHSSEETFVYLGNHVTS